MADDSHIFRPFVKIVAKIESILVKIKVSRCSLSGLLTLPHGMQLGTVNILRGLGTLQPDRLNVSGDSLVGA